jgi:DNA-binding transcriptional ArsR family regulator
MSAADFSQLVGWLRAAGEPSRFRLLVLCSQRDLSVSDLAQALGQSEPRVSRHLRILCEAGLVERLRQGQWVHYRLTASAAAAGFVQGLLAQLDRRDPLVERDLQRALSGGDGQHADQRSSESRLGRALDDFMGAHTSQGSGDCALVIGVEHLELLERAAEIAGACVALAHSRRAAQTARAFAERRGFRCHVLAPANASGLSERDIGRAGEAIARQVFDVVILDQPAASGDDFVRLLGYARRALAPAGYLWLFERYESLERSEGRGTRGRAESAAFPHSNKVIEHPLARLRRLLSDLGLACERLSPIEADGEHVLAALAAPVASREEVKRA